MTVGWLKYRYNEQEENLTKEQRQFKKDVYARLTEARKNGVSAGKIAHEMGDDIHMVYDMLEAKAFSIKVWMAMDKILKKFGY